MHRVDPKHRIILPWMTVVLRLKDPGLEGENKCKHIKRWFTFRLCGKRAQGSLCTLAQYIVVLPLLSGLWVSPALQAPSFAAIFENFKIQRSFLFLVPAHIWIEPQPRSLYIHSYFSDLWHRVTTWLSWAGICTQQISFATVFCVILWKISSHSDFVLWLLLKVFIEGLFSQFSSAFGLIFSYFPH